MPNFGPLLKELKIYLKERKKFETDLSGFEISTSGQVVPKIPKEDEDYKEAIIELDKFLKGEESDQEPRREKYFSIR